VVSRVGPIANARRLAAEDEARVRTEIIRARRAAGLSRTDVGRACGMSRSGVERTESGTRRATTGELACLGAAVGLEVRLKAYPMGDPIRDAGQLRLLARLRSEIHASLGWRTEVALPIPGDRRAWDAVITGSGWRLAVEAETVLTDVQAVERRIELKRRDGRIDHVIIVVADTPQNRRAVRAAGGSLVADPRPPRALLADLRAGRDPVASGVVFL
jgi:transcriptional regulator with XRE-family HTH domain